MPNSGVQVLGSADAVSVTIPIPRVPQQIAIAAAAIAGVLAVVILFRIVRRFTTIRKEDLKHAKRPKASPAKAKSANSKVIIRELHEALIDEMKGTAKMNWIMILLTVVLTLISTLATVFSGEINKFLVHYHFVVPQINNILPK